MAATLNAAGTQASNGGATTQVGHYLRQAN